MVFPCHHVSRLPINKASIQLLPKCSFTHRLSHPICRSSLGFFLLLHLITEDHPLMPICQLRKKHQVMLQGSGLLPHGCLHPAILKAWWCNKTSPIMGSIGETEFWTYLFKDFVQQTLEGRDSLSLEQKASLLTYQCNSFLLGQGQAGLVTSHHKRFNFPRLRFFGCDLRL